MNFHILRSSFRFSPGDLCMNQAIREFLDLAARIQVTLMHSSGSKWLTSWTSSNAESVFHSWNADAGSARRHRRPSHRQTLNPGKKL
ncbi:Hypothetical protein PHPALM_15359 [Phytophthora palmivora]|uniref:Uncharacterized protein n=1 Tax=Phytophthora palmivora TaxID=4796 RepID=A0A2P4XSI6_9STRA|nr:Hypothetical protein PHPALM_15359 [Phytophthora palmivora]